MAVPEVNIAIEQGTYYEDVFTVRNPNGTPLDLTGYTASAAIKKFSTSTTSTPFTVGIITAAGQVVLSMGNTISNALDAGRYYYDVVITSTGTGNITKIIKGSVMVNSSIVV
jgi:hypothetical protein